jgi:hypothetical protein
MIRIETDNDWLLLGHKDHAQLAGEFARHWKNRDFLPPEPFAHVLDAVARHDDSWEERDATPLLTPEMNPSAFSKELVGSYDAFEEIDLDEYLGVRGAATEKAALRDPYAAVLISMHTVNLLTEQADLSTLSDADRTLHSAFIAGQKSRQEVLKADIRAQPDLAPFATEAHFEAGFRFLQACDSLSLYVGVAFEEKGALRHPQKMRDGSEQLIEFIPRGAFRYELAPYPFDEPEIHFDVPYKRVSKSATKTLETFQAAYAAAEIEPVRITLIRP